MARSWSRGHRSDRKTKLALFDIVLFLDDSGSMRGFENGARIDDLKVYVVPS